MPTDWAEYEPVEEAPPPGPDWSEFEPADNLAQKEDLAKQTAAARREGFVAEQGRAITGAAENIAKALALPTQPILQLPRSSDTGIVGGLKNVAAGLAEGVSAPAYWMLPGSRVIKALTAGQMAGDLPRSIPAAVQTISDPNATTAQKIEAGANPLLESAMVAGLARSASVPEKLSGIKPEEPVTEKAPPAAVTEGEAPTAPAMPTAKAQEVAPSTAGQAIPPDITTPANAQVRSVTDAVTEAPKSSDFELVNPAEPQMGAAGAEELPETGTGLKNAVGEMERIGLGIQAAPETVQRNMAKAWNASEQIESAQPGTGANIAARMAQDPNIGLSDTESALLLRHKTTMFNSLNYLAERTHDSDPKIREKAQADYDSLLVDYQGLLDAAKKRGESWGREGRWRQAMVKEDFTFSSTDQINRFYRNSTGEDLPEGKVGKATEIADTNKRAQDSESEAAQKLNDAIQSKDRRSKAEKDAFDAANQTVREWAITKAKLETEARVAEVERTQAEQAVAKDAERRALDAASKTVRENAVRIADEQNKQRLKDATHKRDIAIDNARKIQNQIDAKNREITKLAAAMAKEERRRLSDPSIAIWEAANKYLEDNKGLYSFDDIRSKIAADLGMKVDQVTRWMSKDQTIKRLADDLWNKQRNARRLKEQAKIWVRELDTPGYQKALATIPRSMFSLSVFGHGFVALGTHAPVVAFQPGFWNAYVRNFGRMYKLVFSPAYYERQMQDLVRRDNYVTARRAGLQNDPFKYEEFHTTAVRDLVKGWIGEKNMERVDKATSGGNRGYSVLKVLRQDMFDQAYNRLPKSIRNQDGVAEAIADGINHATGVTAKAAPAGSNIALFAPRLAASRVMWLGGDPIRAAKIIANWKNASTADKVFAKNQMKEKAWVFGTFASLLAANQGLLTASGSKQKINGIPESLGGAGFDPLAADFMKFKALGGNIAYGGALLTMAKLPVRVAYAIAYEGKGSKYVLEDERAGKELLSYLRSQASPFAGTVADLAYGRDYEERPLPAKLFGTIEQTGKVPKRLKNIGVDEPFTWPEYAATKLPIPVAEGIKEGLRSSGMNDKQANAWMKAMAITSLMTGTGTRITEDTREE